MLDNIRKDYRHTIRACYAGYITQAVVNNFVPLLFVQFTKEFSLPLGEITFITVFNFLFQLLVDALSAKFIDRIGYRKSIVAGHFFAASGLALLVFMPDFSLKVCGSALPGILFCVVLYAVGGGVTEVLISPIVEGCPTDDKKSAMSLLHSFYCWGFVFVILASSLFFKLAGIQNWKILAALWAVIPFANAFYFMLVPIFTVETENGEKMSVKELLRSRTFYALAVLMVAAGASEQAVAQWASAIAEKALSLSKTTGDIFGPCAFAFMQGLSRLIYGKAGSRIPIRKALLFCSALCCVSYGAIVLSGSPAVALAGCAVTGFAVGIFWPGTFSLASAKLPGGGTAMFALLALAGDAGCSLGPAVTGFAGNALGQNLRLGVACALVFPLTVLAVAAGMKKQSAEKEEL